MFHKKKERKTKVMEKEKIVLWVEAKLCQNLITVDDVLKINLPKIREIELIYC